MSAYRDIIDRFTDKNAHVVGISEDDVETLKRFKAELELPFPLLSDAESDVSEQFGVYDERGFAHRTTFVIEEEGKIKTVLSGEKALDPTFALEACPVPRSDAS